MLRALAAAAPHLDGVAAVPIGAGAGSVPGVDVVAAGHPWPDQGSLQAAERALAVARRVPQTGCLLVLLSGGASAMLASPASGLTLEDKRETSRVLMAAGAAIDELNCVRKHLSGIKGGRLAAAARGRTVTLALSDVHGPVPDDPSVIGSGPTVPDATSFADALAVLRARHASVPAAVVEHLERGARGDVEETIKPGDPRVAGSTYRVIGNRQTAMTGAQQAAERLGYRAVVLEGATAGEAREAGPDWVRRALALARQHDGPVCVIGSGETTVTVRGAGVGGRNQEFALAAAPAIATASTAVQRTLVLASVGTDGIDGPTDAAGAVVDPLSLVRARELGVNAMAALAANDAYPVFDALGDLLRWGPTGTNVGDLHVLLAG
jgi:glycerate 2-kinase